MNPRAPLDGGQGNRRYLVYTEDDFNQDMVNFLFDASSKPSSEAHLYTVYNHIISTACMSLRHPKKSVSIASSPQPLFATLPPRAGSDATAHAEYKANKKKLLPRQAPDFARFYVDSSDKGAPRRELIDFFEVKPLNSEAPWWSTEAHNLAGEITVDTLEQVYMQAMAAFSHNPDWQRVHALLIVGVYFTHLAWTSRPSEDVLAPFRAPRVPKDSSKLSKPAYDDLIKKLFARIEHLGARESPDKVFYVNEPVFDYGTTTQDTDYQEVTLSQKFLWSLMVGPFKHFPAVQSMCGFMVPPQVKPSFKKGEKSIAEKHVKNSITASQINAVNDQLKALGYVFPGVTPEPATPTPPNSSIADPNHRPPNQNRLENLPAAMKTRAQTAQENMPFIITG